MASPAAPTRISTDYVINVYSVDFDSSELEPLVENEKEENLIVEWIESIQSKTSSKEIIQEMLRIPPFPNTEVQTLVEELGPSVQGCFLGFSVADLKRLLSHMRLLLPSDKYEGNFDWEQIRGIKEETSALRFLFVVLCQSLAEKRLSSEDVSEEDLTALTSTFTLLESKGLVN